MTKLEQLKNEVAQGKEIFNNLTDIEQDIFWNKHSLLCTIETLKAVTDETKINLYIDIIQELNKRVVLGEIHCLSWEYDYIIIQSLVVDHLFEQRICFYNNELIMNNYDNKFNSVESMFIQFDKNIADSILTREKYLEEREHQSPILDDLADFT